jgi:hypothetical protein
MTLLITGCSDENTKINLIIANKSDEIITDIALQLVDKTDVSGNYLKPNQHCYFDMGAQKKCTYKIGFKDKNNQSTLSNEFTSDFNNDDIVNINVLKDKNGKWSIISKN